MNCPGPGQLALVFLVALASYRMVEAAKDDGENDFHNAHIMSTVPCVVKKHSRISRNRPPAPPLPRGRAQFPLRKAGAVPG